MADSESSTPSGERPIRVLVAKAGLDGHDRGAKVVAASLRDAGMEVIYTGLRQTPEMIVQAAIQEDADAIGLSSLSGAHMTLFRRVKTLLDESGASAILLFGGGVIPEKDATELDKEGVGRLFGPGTDTREIVKYLNAEIPKRRSAQEV
jgi:methylmalonyl-CoA mutase, C-terminal domain